MSVEKKLLKETGQAKIYEVKADSYDEFLDKEIEERIRIMDEIGPFSPNQMIPFVKGKELIPIGVILAICLIAHIWAYATIGQ